ncbi:MAG: oligosaccharide flippase family protein [Opitutales bacterium]|nr:oligosaccharide flippase family protein [Opitutales bacterium]
MAIVGKVKAFVFSGHERSVRAKKNVLGLFAVKGYSICVSFFLIPVTLQLLDVYLFGVWITLFNILSWMQIFDVGIGNGLRNKFSEVMAVNDVKQAREYVSTAYFLMAGITLLLLLLFVIPWRFINWSYFFNVQICFGREIRLLVGIAFVLTAILFLLKLIDSLLFASHRPAYSALLLAISNTIIILIFFFAKTYISGSLIAVGLLYTIVPLVVFFTANIILFRGSFKAVRPSIRFFDKKKVKKLLNLGIQFFIIQIAVLVIFQTDSLIIAHVLSPEEVTPYNIVFRYFGVIAMVFAMIITPLWSAYTEALAKGDFAWIEAVLLKQAKAMIVVALIIVCLALFANVLIPLWLQREESIDSFLLFGMAFYTVVSIWNNIFAYLLNGLGKVKLQVITAILGAVVNIPVSIFMAKSYGNGGVVIGTIISLSFFSVLGPIQVFKLVKSWKKN